MDTAIVVIQVVLGLFITVAGLGRLVLPAEKLASLQPWVKDFKPEVVRFISIVEIGIGAAILLPLVMPSFTLLVPLAAVAIALVMAGAMATHLRRGEYVHLAGLLVWLGLALFVAYGTLMNLAV